MEDRGMMHAGAAKWLAVAAAPTFAAMAVVSAVEEGRAASLICAAAGASPILSGMVPMYALMSLFHLGPWLRWIGGRRRS